MNIIITNGQNKQNKMFFSFSHILPILRKIYALNLKKDYYVQKLTFTLIWSRTYRFYLESRYINFLTIPDAVSTSDETRL